MKVREMNKLFLNIFVILSVLILGISMVSSAVTTINSPTTGNLACGNQTINVNVNSTWDDGTINLTFYVKSSLTANSSWTEVGSNNSLNMTLLGNKSVTTIDFINNKVEDSNDYVLNVTAINSTGARLMVGNATVSSLIVDCSIPDAPTSLTPTSVSTNSIAFSSTVTGTKTTSCTLFFSGINPGASNYAMTHSGNNCSYTFTSIPEQSYQWYVRASDETNTTDSSTQTTKVDVKTSAGKAGQYIQQGLAKSEGGASFSIVGNGLADKPIAIVGIILGVVLVIGVVVVLIKKRR